MGEKAQIGRFHLKFFVFSYPGVVLPVNKSIDGTIRIVWQLPIKSLIKHIMMSNTILSKKSMLPLQKKRGSRCRREFLFGFCWKNRRPPIGDT